jgi:hypothetical protein
LAELANRDSSGRKLLPPITAAAAADDLRNSRRDVSRIRHS